jgi:formate hydrogenlyase subunit 3/multisubunit Na+/H+ antiporter MnhD subunit
MVTGIPMTSIEVLFVLLAPGLPLALSGLALSRALRHPVLIHLVPFAALPSLAAALIVDPGTGIDMPWLFLGTRLGVDATGRVFLFVTAFLWLVAGAFGRSYLVKDRAQFFAFYLLAMSGNLGLILAQDMLSFYLFFALMSFSSYALVIHYGDPEARQAGRVYMYLVVLGEVLLFVAMATIANTAETLLLSRVAAMPPSNFVVALVLAGFGIKAGALPLHIWLPLAHPAAPVPASAVLSGAMIKAGLLGWLRFLPLGHVALPEWGALCMATGLAAAFFGVFAGLPQSNPKTVLAYSSISQMGLLTLGVGLGLVAPPAWPFALSAVLISSLHHGLAKGGLFLGAGVAPAAGDKRGQRWLVTAGLILPAMALAGMPLTSGAIAKIALKSSTALLPAPWPGWLDILLSLAAAGTTLLMARFLYLVWPRGTGAGRLPVGLWFPWATLLAAVAVATWLWPGARGPAEEALSSTNLLIGFWPVGLGTLIAWVSLKVKKGKALHIPAGDILVIGTWITKRIGQSLSLNIAEFRVNARARYSGWRLFYSELMPDYRHRLNENWLMNWTVVGFLYLSTVIIFFILLALA